ncbi:helicase-associated domain-containing protein [Ammoniphilus sp. CFH 90114]|uniref:helicase-associated domain-containing protein n=1 Tax=Ammoniphilus sp. CFH 90114 TaxID=2493665 RepID=UPI0013E8FE10|nr:helicase-associated domain-containing protein [Ammoniphilus sp. CFH 90114]
MLWTETVGMLSDRVKKQIIQEHGESGEDLSFVLEPEYIDRCWKGLAADEQDVIRYFISEKGEDFLTYREMEQGDPRISTARFRVALTRLRRLGFIFTLRRLWGELAYVMPRELLTLFRRQMVSENLSWKRGRTLPAPTSYHILQDILQALNNVRYHPLELTKKGTVSKKSIRQLFTGLQMDKEMFPSSLNLPPCLPPYDKHEAILLDLLSRWELLEVREDGLHLGNVDRWIQRTHRENLIQFCDLLYAYLDLSPRMQFYWDITFGLERNQVFSVRSILASMKEDAPTYESVVSQWIKPLSQMGIIHSVQIKDDSLWMWREENEWPNSPIYVQPNFEILLPAFSSLKIKWELLSFCSLEKKEEMWSLVLTRQSVQPYFSAGNTANELLALLEQYSAIPLTDAMKEVVSQWEKDFQQVSIFDCRIMQVSHADLALEMERIPAISRFIRARLGERAFMIHAVEFDQLKDELEKRGYPIGSVQDLLVHQQEQEMLSLQVFKTGFPISVDYKVESVFPELEDAIPGLRQLPKMWLSNYSSYHESTLRELIQKAAQLKMELRMQWKGKEYRLHPVQVVNKNGYWHVQGLGNSKEEQDIRLQDIGNIQILWP